jgi:hypothetical protein
VTAVRILGWHGDLRGPVEFAGVQFIAVWTYAMGCPECTGCGCSNGRCSGWRHHTYMTDDERAELSNDDVCDECGADCSLGSYELCSCG